MELSRGPGSRRGAVWTPCQPSLEARADGLTGLPARGGQHSHHSYSSQQRQRRPVSGCSQPLPSRASKTGPAQTLNTVTYSLLVNERCFNGCCFCSIIHGES